MRINKGFTIIELLIVIVIIGILVAITAVSYTGITNGANTATAQSNANAVKKKATACHAKNGGTWPAATAIASCDGGGISLPTGVSVVAATTIATADTAIAAAGQKTIVGWNESTGTAYYWDSAKSPAGSVAL